jgi:hypothetical protein
LLTRLILQLGSERGHVVRSARIRRRLSRRLQLQATPVALRLRQVVPANQHAHVVGLRCDDLKNGAT